jgi:hypothetical protein
VSETKVVWTAQGRNANGSLGTGTSHGLPKPHWRLQFHAKLQKSSLTAAQCLRHFYFSAEAAANFIKEVYSTADAKCRWSIPRS